MPKPRKHHSVPQSVLRPFSIGKLGRQIYAFDKSQGTSFPMAVRDAGSERDFYQVAFQGRQVNFEPAFQEIDDVVAQVVDALLKEDLKVLDNNIISRLTAIARARGMRCGS